MAGNKALRVLIWLGTWGEDNVTSCLYYWISHCVWVDFSKCEQIAIKSWLTRGFGCFVGTSKEIGK